MRFQGLACDYDGTLASDDRIREQTHAEGGDERVRDGR